MIALDTNVIVRYAVRDDAAQTRRVDRLFDGLTDDDPAFIGHVVLVELWWVLTGAYRFGREVCCDFIDRLLTIDVFTVERSDVVHSALRRARDGAGFPDALTAAAAFDSGCSEVVTLDRHAARRAGMSLLT